MSPVGAVTVAAAAMSFAGFVWTVYQLVEVGSDGHAAGPWRRPEPNERPTRLPADFVALWSLFGSRSMREYAGSWEAAVSRLDRLEANLLDLQGASAGTQLAPPPAPPSPPSPPPGPPPGLGARFRRRASGHVVADPVEASLHRRLERLETLAGMTGPPDSRTA